MEVLDVLGKRWALRIVWELREGSHTFRALRKACGNISPTVLNARLAELRGLGIVTADNGYSLTSSGVELGGIVLQLNDWAKRAAGRHKFPSSA